MVAPIDVNKFIRDKSNEHTTELYAAIDSDIQDFMAATGISLETFVADYILEMGPTELAKVYGGVVGMDLDLRSDTSTVKFVTHYRIRRKTEEERLTQDSQTL